MLVAVFWALAILSLYSYFLYPIALKLLPGRKRSAPAADGDNPELSLSVVITVHNEANRIRQKLDNALDIDFPAERLEIIVTSDCSDDGTDDIVREYTERGVKLVRAQQRLGKENAQLAAIEKAEGDVIVFSDAATEIPKDALTKMARYFADPRIGAVSSEDRFTAKDGGVVGEGAYVKYEMWLRQQESRLAGLVGLSGSFFAARKSVCQAWDIHSPSDFNTALNCAKADMVAVTAPDVLGYYQDLKDPSKEYQRKIRTVIRGMTALSRHPEVLNPFKFGWFSFQLISHKLMRWLVPWFLLALLVVSALVSHQGFIYQLALLAQLVFYGLALAAHYSERLRSRSVTKIIYFFVQVNLALFDACCRFLAGKRMTVWQPSAR
ncbi:glycosyltransferase family 2 protein [Exilibacterium tricleocarpae]|uniref:Glycosyltransferase family 2 protein n=1 Tax=Exilibacterium tricleocarpae TaxID=2591008 RepID=A0A545T3H8_9GAMM|nr:glycosyltransferase family 2 protein [Exilibacterium tricleocarpae]TQV71745.1 glycosyltransferase family 2 protein [Exilibacterium tricleocarpae]